MDSGNNSNQQQRYCPTPIMAPPSVAGSPPIMGGGNVMASIHQTPHHPPPSISPHPAAYYGIHSASTSHYPTPSPTPPPPIHHQQYYAHQYYAHGSHQQQAQQQQQQQTPQSQQHHAMSNAHVPLNATPTAHQQGQQHPHLMGHTSYHHSQPQTHHQQWAAPPHPHQQQQSHHYYHQSPHHAAAHQQQPQQHGYPPPPHSPYPYTQPHPPPPTPPPHSPHPQQHIQPQQQQQQQHQSHPPVPSSPCPTQMHQAPQQQPQSHALMNLSRFVSQQNPNPSPCPSPRASPSLATHLSQVSQMAPQSPSPFSGHIDHHHSSMNGHVSGGPTSPMSPPPPPHHSQQVSAVCVSPPPPVPQLQQHHLPAPQMGYNVNGGGMGDIACSKNSSNYSDKQEQSDEAVDEMIRITSEEIRTRERDMLSILPNLSSTIHSTNENDNVNMTLDSDQSSKVTSSTGCGEDRVNSNTNSNSNATTLPSTIMSGEDMLGSTILQSGVINNGNITPDIQSSSSGCDATVNQTASVNTNASNGGTSRASVSPQMKPIGSPTNPGNGHQMMPVRLQNMQKGARTKASMKKLMQEQQITTPNGQATETSSETSQISAKDSDSLEATVEPVPKPETKTKGRSPARKKKSAAALSPAIPTDPFVSQSSVIVSDLTTGAVSAIPVARPGYTKSGKKIGRPRKDASSANVPSETKPKASKGSKSPKKTKASTTPQFSEPMQVPESELATALSETVASLEETVIPIIEEPNNAVVKADRPSKLKAAKTNPRKRSSKVLNDTGDEHEEQEESSQVSTTVATVDLNIPPLIIKSSQISPVINEFTPTSIPLGGKRRKQSKSNFTIVQPDVNLSLSAPESSEISQQEAESVATRVAQSLPSPPKAKGRRRKSTNSTKESRKRKSLKQKAAITQPKVISVKEIDTSPERRDLPRLRSRSPKQGESPPLRISSPRAAKERSSTPASTTSQASPQRPRASKEKDTSRGAITPLSSPTLRSPKKESPRGKVGGRKGKQKVEENVVVEEPQDNLLLSPPPAKRLRQMSKESTDSEIQGRRRTSVVETRLSIESEKSRPLAGKRSSRRKSGSVSGSIDNALSSPTPSLNQSNSSLNMQSEISLEVTAPSSSLDSSFEIKSDVAEISTQEESTSTAINNVVDLPPRRKGKGKGKRATKKPRSRLKKLRASTEIVEGVVFTEDEPALEDVIVVLPESQEETPTSPTPVTPPVSPTVKSKKQKKTSVKKGKKAVLLVTENVPFQDIPEPSVDVPTVIEVQVPVVPKQQRKRKSSAKTPKATVPIQPPVLNIPEFTPPKKEVKVKPRLRKGSKQGKKSSKKGGAQKLESLVLVSPPIVPPPETEPPLIEEPISNAQPTFSQPQDLSPSRRRRPSVVSPNTQTSAKSSSSSGMESPSKVKSETTGVGTPASPTKSQRRDSRSVSRDYDVSVVLTDIAQSLSSGDYSFANISNTFTRQSLQSPPSNSQPLISPPIPIEPAVSPLKVETCSGNSDELDVKGKIPKKKRQSKTNSIPNSELLERKATLEAEVAQVLLEMKSGNSSSSKSPSPAKSIPIVEVNDETITTITPRKKQTKQRKRKNSTTPRRSKASVKQEISAELDSSLSPIAATPGLVAPLNHTRKRKMMKMNAKPASKAKLKAKSLASTLPVLSSTPIVGNTANVDKDGFIGTSIALTPVAPVTTVKVSKTASIPTASSFDMSATTPVYAVKSKPELKQKAKNLTRKRKERTKIAKSSPDITAFSTSKSSATPITPTIEPITKRRRKKAGKSEETADGEVKNVKSQVSSLIGPGMEADVSASSPDAPLKKKRQRKRKGESDAATASSSIAVDSANDPATTSKLFPYQTQPKEMKKPTVFSKRTPFVEDKVRKYEDNQKKKPNEGPSLRVIGGLAKFYRGGEEEQVDQDPKLPKEKAPLQTDNAVPWICSFCHMGPHAQKLGDLFGPYFANLPSIYGNPSPKRETWMHGDCALWAGRLQMIGTHLRNLEVTLSNADKETCTVCGKTGATMGCLRRHCKQAVHYPCAIRRFWKIDAAIFHSYCPEHIP